ncbi:MULTISPECIES: hypothetical protein [Aerosakkonema]|uniref:hypothetical protein n=1 Tax=Aerosakkonema TaxID=1246629 RepID=UPI0035BA258E
MTDVQYGRTQLRSQKLRWQLELLKMRLSYKLLVLKLVPERRSELIVSQIDLLC